MARRQCGCLCTLLALTVMAPAQDPPGKASTTEKSNNNQETNPRWLQRPLTTPPPPPPPSTEIENWVETPVDPPLGFAGRSGIFPDDVQIDGHFVPAEDRWRMGFPAWDRYGKGHPLLDDYPYVEGWWLNPYKQNVLKGDYPIWGQHTFLEITAASLQLLEVRQLPTATTPFESTLRPFQEEFFGQPNQFFYQHNLALTVDLFHGDAGFKPADWRVRLTPIFNMNYVDVNELAVVNPNVLKGTTRGRTFTALQEYFVETKLSDLSPYYDFVSLRAGSQPFVSDFRGFIFNDVNRGVRLFGTRNSNRDQFNLLYFRQSDKDTNSELNNFDDRGQDVVVANYFRQDTIWPGYTAQVSFHYNHDSPSFVFDSNDNLVRPDPAGVFQPHDLNVFYLGWAGDGHINRLNISHQIYYALGNDSRNPIANGPQDISALMGAVELSYDRDWVRFRTSYFYASGDSDPNNRRACGFDSILDNPNFVGGQFSYWQRQAIRLFSVNLTNRGSLLPDLRASKIQGQANFVNPGIQICNLGIDIEITPKLRMINNVNFLWFDQTEPLETFLFDGSIDHFIGVDPSIGFEYRPLLNNNVIITMGLSGLIPGEGFRDIYNSFKSNADPLIAGFLEMALVY